MVSKGILPHVLVLGGYLVLVLLMTVPAGFQPHVYIIGSGGDPWQTMWRFTTHLQQLNSAEFWSSFFGGGAPRLVNYSTLPWIWIAALVDQPLAYNTIWFFSFVLSGYCMYVLAAYVTRGHQIASVLAGIAYMFLPFHVAHAYGHFGAMQIQWLPLLILLTLMFFRKPNAWTALALGVLFSIQILSEHHYAMWFAIFVCWYVLFHWKSTWRVVASPRVWPLIFLTGAIIFCFGVLPYWPTVRLAAQPGDHLSLGVAQTVRFSADLFSFLVPASFHSLWGKASFALFGSEFTSNVSESSHYLGLVMLLFVIFYVRGSSRLKIFFWLSVIVLFGLIALGPRLHVLGHVFSPPLPYALFDSLPVFSAVRAVSRASVMVGLSVCILFGLAVAKQVRRKSMGVLLGFLLLVDFLCIPFPVESAHVSPLYSVVASWSGTSVIEIPAATNYAIASRALYAGLLHEKDAVGSIALERATGAEPLKDVRSLPALRQLLYVRTGHIRANRDDFFGQELVPTFFEAARWVQAGGVILHLDSLSPLQVSTLRNFLEKQAGLTPAIHEDVAMYALPDEMPAQADGVFLSRDSNWSTVGVDEKTGESLGSFTGEATVTLYNVRSEPVSVRLEFDIREGALINVQSGDVFTVPAMSNIDVVFRGLEGRRVVLANPGLYAMR